VIEPASPWYVHIPATFATGSDPLKPPNSGLPWRRALASAWNDSLI
jgi:hypothetical protein